MPFQKPFLTQKIKRLSAPLLLVTLAACTATSDYPPNRASPGATGRAPSVLLDLPPMKMFGDVAPAPTLRSNAAIARDFIDLSFQLESGTRLMQFSRFEGPITLRVVGTSVPRSLGPDLDTLLTRLRTEAGIDITRVSASSPANITVQTLPHAELRRRAPNTACIVAPNVSSWDDFRVARRPDVSWTTVARRETLAIFIPDDEAPQEIRDCLHEELAQALGPLNDLYRLSDSVFNDDNIHSVLTDFDMLILRATYAPQLRSGMSRTEVAARLPAILARLNPTGARMSTQYVPPTPREWINDIVLAMGAETLASDRRAAAIRAVALSRAQGWTDTRMGFSLFLLGRLSMGSDPTLAELALTEARAIYGARKDTAYHAANVALQLSALALTRQDYDAVLALTADAMPAAHAGGNAALLASLMMTKAEALTALGRASEARAVRVDSLGWARYGFGSDAQVRARATEIAALAR